ncbi:MAG: hypothetical protein AB7G13_18920 [Lautropia sp.]
MTSTAARPAVRVLASPLTALAALAALAGCSSLPPADAATPVPLRGQFATQCAAGAADAGLQLTAFRDAAAWRRQLATLIAAPGADAGAAQRTLAAWRVDFTAGEAVLLVDAGQRPNPGHRLVLGQPAAQLRGDRLEVRAAVERPPAGSIQPQVIVHPCLYLHVGATGFRWVGFAAD